MNASLIKLAGAYLNNKEGVDILIGNEWINAKRIRELVNDYPGCVLIEPHGVGAKEIIISNDYPLAIRPHGMDATGFPGRKV